MIVVLFGVSGAGKTSIGKLLAEEMGWRFYDADDFHPAANIEKMRLGVPLTDTDRRPWLDRLRDQLEECAAAEEDAILACSALKRKYRERLRVNAEVKFVYLRADSGLIAARLRQREDHFMNPALLASQMADLEEPAPDENAVAIDASKGPAAIVTELRETLSRLA